MAAETTEAKGTCLLHDRNAEALAAFDRKRVREAMLYGGKELWQGSWRAWSTLRERDQARIRDEVRAQLARLNIAAHEAQKLLTSWLLGTRFAQGDDEATGLVLVKHPTSEDGEASRWLAHSIGEGVALLLMDDGPEQEVDRRLLERMQAQAAERQAASDQEAVAAKFRALERQRTEAITKWRNLPMELRALLRADDLPHEVRMIFDALAAALSAEQQRLVAAIGRAGSPEGREPPPSERAARFLGTPWPLPEG